MIDLAAFVERSETNGPGVRAVIWAQGCPRTPPCRGCANPEMLAVGRPAARIPVDELVRRVAAIPGLAGLTLTGGEPFLQAEGLARVAAPLRARGLTVVTLSGHTLEELAAARRPDWDALLAQTDLLVDGPYLAERPAAAPLRGSANQRLHFLSGRIRPDAVAALPAAAFEVVIDSRGSALATGFPGSELLHELRSVDHG